MHSSKLHVGSQNPSSRHKPPKRELYLQIFRIMEIIQFDNHNAVLIIAFSLQFAVLLHIMLAYLLLSNQPAATGLKDLLTSFMQNQTAYRVIQSLAYSLKVAEIAAVIVGLQVDRNSLLGNICARFLKFLVVISEIDLFATSLLLLLRLPENILPFLLSSCISIFLSVLGSNCSNRKLATYRPSILIGFIFKMLQVTLLLGNSIMFLTGSPVYFHLFHFSFGILLILWYRLGGNHLHIHSISKMVNMGYMALHITLLVLFAESYILGTHLIELINIARYLSTFIIIFYYVYAWDARKRMDTNKLRGIEGEIKEIDLEFHRILQESTSDYDKDSFMIGLFQLHRFSNCQNFACYTHHITCYDPTLRASINTSHQTKESQSLLRFHLKCLYDQAFSSSPQDSVFLLDYVEFLLNECFDLFLFGILFNKIERNDLSALEMIRLHKLKVTVKKESEKTNHLVYEGNLEIQSVVKAENTFHSICVDVSKYLSDNLAIWATIRCNDINITALDKKVKKNLAVLDRINDKWTAILPFLPLQKQWKDYYQNYCQFVLNERSHQKSNEEAEYPQNHKLSIHLEPLGHKQLLTNKTFLFDKTTMYMHTYLSNGVSIVIRTNSVFEELTGYSESELKGIELNQLLPPAVQQVHDQSLLNWLKKGESNNYDQYPIRFTELQVRDGSHIPVIKYFKMVANLHGQGEHFLEFVCMLKLNSVDNFEEVDEQANCGFGTVSANKVNQNFLEKEGKVTLRSQNNPFLKQENLQAVEMLGEVIEIKRGLRILFVALLLITVGLSFLSTANANSLNAYSLQYINFLNLYRYPMAFGKNVLKIFMGVGNQTKAANQIHLEVTQIAQLLTDPMTVQSIFDQNLNRPRMYYPFQNDSYNKGIGYNQIDLIYFVTSCIQSLNTLPANRTGQAFTNFNMYIAPAYDSLINSTKMHFHDSFSTIFSSMLDYQYIVLAVEAAVFVLAAAYLARTSWQYVRKSRATLKIVLDFGDEEVVKVILYCRRLRIYFASFSNEAGSEDIRDIRQLNKIHMTEEALLERREERGEITMNKKAKNIYRCRKEDRRWMCRIVLLVCLMLAVLAGLLSYQIVNIVTINHLKTFEEDGFYFLRYFPATSVLGHAILERYYNQQFPKEINFYPQRYAESISDLNLIGHAVYIGESQMPNSQYFQDRKSYLFGNPCTANPAVLVAAETTTTKCLSIYNRTFSQGITTFLRACEPQINDFLNKRINLTAAQVDQVTVALTLVAYYITDAIQQWSVEFSALIADFSSINKMLCGIICCLLFVLHMTASEWRIFGRLEMDYAGVRRLFKHLVPQEILIKQKVVKQKFVINGILPQD